MVLAPVDWIVVAVYFLLIAGLAWWVLRQRQQTSTDYFLAGRHLGWFVVGASIFASNIGSEHLVGLAGSGATDGVAMSRASWSALEVTGSRVVLALIASAYLFFTG
jgi:SSS family solute:Na+ symporter